MDYREVDTSLHPQLHSGLKLSWAKRHLHALNEEVGKFLKGKTHTIRTKDDFEAGEYIIYLDPTPINVEIGLISGDAICCMRASLDHIACALTLAPGGTRNDKASFPIIPIDNSKGRKLFAKSVVGIPEDAVKIIRLFQPHTDGDAYHLTKLWKLHRLWNIDKHRRIPMHGAGAQMPVRFPPDMPPISSGSNNSGVMRFPLSAKPHIEFNPAVKINIYLGDEAEGIIVPLRELFEIYDFIHNEIFTRLKHFF